ncbi:hypothetical protein JL720_15200 [Aureococcus anophagefferens]|nr:hypothetical protein JL720_15200 [Aureococcus anophagefferens]
MSSTGRRPGGAYGARDGRRRAAVAAARLPEANKAQLEWVGKFFDDDGAVWQVDDIRYDEEEKQNLVLRSACSRRPRPRLGDTSWYNWAEIPRFRHSFSKQLRLRAVRYAPKSPGYAPVRERAAAAAGTSPSACAGGPASVADLGGDHSRAFV